MDETKKAEIVSILDTPLGQLTPRQILSGVMFIDDATDEDLAEVGLPPQIREL